MDGVTINAQRLIKREEGTQNHQTKESDVNYDHCFLFSLLISIPNGYVSFAFNSGWLQDIVYGNVSRVCPQGKSDYEKQKH